MVKEAMKENEKAIVSYILGILSIVFAIISPFAGILISIVGIAMSKNKSNDLEKRARKLSVIGIVLSIVMFLVSIAVVYFIKINYPQLFQAP